MAVVGKGFHWYSGSVSQASKHQISTFLEYIVFGNIITVVMQTSIFVVVTSTLLISFNEKCTVSSKQMRLTQNI